MKLRALRTRPAAVPVYRQIQNAIRQQLEEGQLKSGDLVESERELARRYGVSLMTARHALGGLEREGIVERRRGAGTFIAPPRIHFNKLMSLSEAMASRGLNAVSRLLSMEQVSNEPEISARLSLASDAALFRVQRLRRAGNEAFALETCYLALKDFSDLTQTDLEHHSLFHVLEHHYGLTLSYADEEVNATAADGNTARLLRVQRGAPLLRLCQVIYTSQARPTVYVVGLYRSDRHTLFIRRFR